MTGLSDEQLIKQYLAGDSASLEVLIGKYLNSVYNFIFKYLANQEEAEDAAQETFVKIWKNAKKFDPEYKFRTWAFTIAKNTALDHIKKKGLVPFAVMEENDDESETNFKNSLVSYEPLPEEALSRLEDMAMVGRAVGGLSQKYQQILWMYYHQELNFREIAETLK